MLLQLSVTAGLVAAGWSVASRLKIPASAILGPMIMVGLASSAGLIHLELPYWLRVVLQIVVGAYVGYRVQRSALAGMRSMLGPLVASTVWVMIWAVLIGLGLTKLTGISATTSLLGAAPGGAAEMSAMAGTIDADVALVATMQAFRLISILVLIPVLVRRMAPAPALAVGAGAVATAALPLPVATPTDEDAPIPAPCAPYRYAWPVCLLIAAAGGSLFTLLGAPAPGIIGSMLFVAAARLRGLSVAPLPPQLRTVAQLGIGLMIGVSFSQETLLEIQTGFVPLLGVTGATLLSSMAVARILQTWLGVDAQTALLACAPAGLTQMVIVGDELGADTVVISLFQMARLMSVLLIFPWLARLALG